jgi:uncharacterized protein involved in exopolysaccharide biosynthesis
VKRAAALAFAAAALGAACEQRYVAVGTLEIDPALSMETQLEVLTSRALAQRVSRALGAAAELELDQFARARRRGDSRVIEVEVRDPDYRRATLVCDTILRAYLERRAEQGHTGDARIVDTCVARR